MTNAATAVMVVRLVEASEAAVADVNALVPQLKPSGGAVTTRNLTDLLSSPTCVYVARAAGTIVGLTLMVPHRHFGGLRYHIEDVVVSAEHRRSGTLGGYSKPRWPTLLQRRSRSIFVLTVRARRHTHLYRSLGFEASDTTVFRRLVDPAHSGGSE